MVLALVGDSTMTNAESDSLAFFATCSTSESPPLINGYPTITAVVSIDKSESSLQRGRRATPC